MVTDSHNEVAMLF